MTDRQAASLNIGDRDLCLEADVGVDVVRDNPLVGGVVEVSPVAGGDLLSQRGETGEITGVIYRLGQLVGYEVKVGETVHHGSAKDFFVYRDVLEDIQPPTPTSAALREGLSHWDQQRTYWHTRTDGLESLCFELASATPTAIPKAFPWGWQFLVPDPMPGRHSVVDCRASLHGNFWTLSVSVYPVDAPLEEKPLRIQDHWTRTLAWTNTIALAMTTFGFPWKFSARNINARGKASEAILRPMVDGILTKALAEKSSGDVAEIPPVFSAGFSDVRLKAGTVGLTEPPTDRRPYSVLSISPGAAKDRSYLNQVVLHEVLHMVVASTGGKPHNEEFTRLADALGLEPEHRD